MRCMWRRTARCKPSLPLASQASGPEECLPVFRRVGCGRGPDQDLYRPTQGGARCGAGLRGQRHCGCHTVSPRRQEHGFRERSNSDGCWIQALFCVLLEKYVGWTTVTASTGSGNFQRPQLATRRSGRHASIDKRHRDDEHHGERSTHPAGLHRGMPAVWEPHPDARQYEQQQEGDDLPKLPEHGSGHGRLLAAFDRACLDPMAVHPMDRKRIGQARF